MLELVHLVSRRLVVNLRRDNGRMSKTDGEVY